MTLYILLVIENISGVLSEKPFWAILGLGTLTSCVMNRKGQTGLLPLDR